MWPTMDYLGWFEHLLKQGSPSRCNENHGRPHYIEFIHKSLCISYPSRLRVYSVSIRVQPGISYGTAPDPVMRGGICTYNSATHGSSRVMVRQMFCPILSLIEHVINCDRNWKSLLRVIRNIRGACADFLVLIGV